MNGRKSFYLTSGCAERIAIFVLLHIDVILALGYEGFGFGEFFVHILGFNIYVAVCICTITAEVETDKMVYMNRVQLRLILEINVHVVRLDPGTYK